MNTEHRQAATSHVVADSNQSSSSRFTAEDGELLPSSQYVVLTPLPCTSITEASVGNRVRKNSIHTAQRDATRRDSFVASGREVQMRYYLLNAPTVSQFPACCGRLFSKTEVQQLRVGDRQT